MSSVDSTTVKYMPANAPRNTDTRTSGSVSTSVRPLNSNSSQTFEVVEAGPAGDRVGRDGQHPEQDEEPDQRGDDERDLQRLAEDHDQADVEPLADDSGSTTGSSIGSPTIVAGVSAR